jgi:HEAT repeat protein
LIQIGAPALDVLRKAAVGPDLEVARLAKECIERIERNAQVATFLRQLKADKQEERHKGANGLMELGPEVAEVIPALTELLDTPDIELRESVVRVLLVAPRSAQLALPKLLRILKDKSPGTESLRMYVISLLERMGPPGREAIPILLQILETEGPVMQRYAVFGLAELGQDDPRVVPALLKGLSQDEITVKHSAACALAWLRKEPEKTVSAMLQILTSYPFKDEEVALSTRLSLVRALGGYGPEAEPAIPYLIKVCKKEQPGSQLAREAKKVLVAMGAPAHKAIPGLKELGPRPTNHQFFRLIQQLDQE